MWRLNSTTVTVQAPSEMTPQPRLRVRSLESMMMSEPMSDIDKVISNKDLTPSQQVQLNQITTDLNELQTPNGQQVRSTTITTEQIVVESVPQALIRVKDKQFTVPLTHMDWNNNRNFAMDGCLSRAPATYPRNNAQYPGIMPNQQPAVPVAPQTHSRLPRNMPYVNNQQPTNPHVNPRIYPQALTYRPPDPRRGAQAEPYAMLPVPNFSHTPMREQLPSSVVHYHSNQTAQNPNQFQSSRLPSLIHYQPSNLDAQQRITATSHPYRINCQNTPQSRYGEQIRGPTFTANGYGAMTIPPAVRTRLDKNLRSPPEALNPSDRLQENNSLLKQIITQQAYTPENAASCYPSLDTRRAQPPVSLSTTTGAVSPNRRRGPQGPHPPSCWPMPPYSNFGPVMDGTSPYAPSLAGYQEHIRTSADKVIANKRKSTSGGGPSAKQKAKSLLSITTPSTTSVLSQLVMGRQPVQIQPFSNISNNNAGEIRNEESTSSHGNLVTKNSNPTETANSIMLTKNSTAQSKNKQPLSRPWDLTIKTVPKNSICFPPKPPESRYTLSLSKRPRIKHTAQTSYKDWLQKINTNNTSITSPPMQEKVPAPKNSLDKQSNGKTDVNSEINYKNVEKNLKTLLMPESESSPEIENIPQTKKTVDDVRKDLESPIDPILRTAVQALLKNTGMISQSVVEPLEVATNTASEPSVEEGVERSNRSKHQEEPNDSESHKEPERPRLQEESQVTQSQEEPPPPEPQEELQLPNLQEVEPDQCQTQDELEACTSQKELTFPEVEKDVALCEAEKELTLPEAKKELTLPEAEKELTLSEAEKELTLSEAEKELTLSEAEKELTLPEVQKEPQLALSPISEPELPGSPKESEPEEFEDFEDFEEFEVPEQKYRPESPDCEIIEWKICQKQKLRPGEYTSVMAPGVVLKHCTVKLNPLLKCGNCHQLNDKKEIWHNAFSLRKWCSECIREVPSIQVDKELSTQRKIIEDQKKSIQTLQRRLARMLCRASEPPLTETMYVCENTNKRKNCILSDSE